MEFYSNIKGLLTPKLRFLDPKLAILKTLCFQMKVGWCFLKWVIGHKSQTTIDMCLSVSLWCCRSSILGFVRDASMCRASTASEGCRISHCQHSGQKTFYFKNNILYNTIKILAIKYKMNPKTP